MTRNRAPQNTALVAAAYIAYKRSLYSDDAEKRRLARERYLHLCSVLSSNERARLTEVIRNGAKSNG